MSKSRLHNLELVHLNIWLNLMQNEGYRMCKRWTNTSSGYLNFKRDSFKQFLNHVEQFGIYKTFVGLQNLNGEFSPDNCYWTTKQIDFSKHPYKPDNKTTMLKTKDKNIKNKPTNTKVVSLIDFKKKKQE